MWPKNSTAQNSPTRGFNGTVHPSGLQTSGFQIFEPNKQQIESAARRALDDPITRPRRRISPFYIVFGAIGLGALVYAGTYFVLSAVIK